MTPPNDKQVEMALLGCLLQQKNIITAVESCGGKKLFYTSKHENIYGAILSQAEVGEVDVITVSSRLGGQSSYLLQCISLAPSPLLAPSYSDTLKELYLKREILKLCHNTTYNLENQNILNELEQGVRNIAKQVSKIKHTDAGNLVADLWEDYIENEGVTPDYMKTGLLDLDRMIDGLEHTEHIIIAGRASMGKTAFACDVVRNVAKQGRKIIFFTMEMSEKVLMRRLLCAEADVRLKGFRNRRLHPAEKIRASRVLSEIKKWDLQVIEGRVTVSDIKSKVAQDEPDLVVVDYLQLMELDRRGGMNTNDLVGDNVKGLQGIAKTGPAVITLSQLSRASEKEKRRPNLSDLYESGAIEAAGDKILMPYREDKESEEAEILVVKQKDGPVGKVDALFVKDSVTFRSLARTSEPPAVRRGGLDG